jgi:hypothetical protein
MKRTAPLLLFNSSLALIEQGDELWCEEKYSEAIKTWRSIPKDAPKASQAMKQYRLMRGTSNVEWFLNGLQGDLSLFECENTDAYCLLARIDRDLIYQEIGLPNELDMLKEYFPQLQKAIPREASSRGYLMGLYPKEDIGEVTDALGVCLKEKGELPPLPIRNQWGGNISLQPRLGVGGSLAFYLPNIKEKSLDFSIAYTTKRVGHARFRFQTLGTYWLYNDNMVRQGLYYQKVYNKWASFRITNGHIQLAPGYAWKTGKLWLGVEYRLDEYYFDDKFDGTIRGHGITGGLRTTFKPQWFYSMNVNYTWLDYNHFHVGQRLSYSPREGFAFMLVADVAPNTEAPWWRHPTAGGGQYVRIAYVQRYRSDLLFAENFEYRWWPTKTLGTTFFAEFLQSREELYYAGGIGLRLRTAEKGPTIYRMDIGYSNIGTNISINVSEFF